MKNQEKIAFSIRKEMVQSNLKGMRTVAWSLMYVSAIISLFIMERFSLSKQKEPWSPSILPFISPCFI